MYKYIKFLLVFMLCALLACKQTNNKPLSIQFAADSTKIIFTGIDPVGLAHLRNNLATDSAYQKLVSVLQTPAEDDSTSTEIEWPGKLSLSGDTLTFSPNTAFKRGKAYRVETMLNVEFGSKKDIVRSEVGHQVSAQQKLLLR